MGGPSTTSDDDAADEKEHQYHHQHRAPRRKPPVVTSSLLQPRVAVLLGVPKFWHPFLFACRLLSIAPAIWWGVRCALRFVITDLLKAYGYSYSRVGGLRPEAAAAASKLVVDRGEWMLRLTETALSIVWCGAAANLSFIFTDSLMSRWLLNYTPQATMVRLLTLCCIFGTVSSQLIHLLGGDRSPSLLLPAWIGIATTLTACYHVSQRQINIRKETSASISVFSIASFISMVALLANLHFGTLGVRREYPDIPLAAILRRAAEIGGKIVVTVLGVNRERDGL
ncbi:hypothetical protein JX266_002767 [Neoarthrinium moseri]|nr:hypothetical protein JX266_002767 [Neoarthrinium moseri]